jgi:hypothetical protein
MKAAPAFDCANCGRRIGKAGCHWLINGEVVMCTRCVDSEDLYDGAVHGTRAGIAAVLGVWP